MAKLLKIAETKDVPPGQAAAFTIEGQKKIARFGSCPPRAKVGKGELLLRFVRMDHDGAAVNAGKKGCAENRGDQGRGHVQSGGRIGQARKTLRLNACDWIAPKPLEFRRLWQTSDWRHSCRKGSNRACDFHYYRFKADLMNGFLPGRSCHPI